MRAPEFSKNSSSRVCSIVWLSLFHFSYRHGDALNVQIVTVKRKFRWPHLIPLRRRYPDAGQVAEQGSQSRGFLYFGASQSTRLFFFLFLSAASSGSWIVVVISLWLYLSCSWAATSIGQVFRQTLSRVTRTRFSRTNSRSLSTLKPLPLPNSLQNKLIKRASQPASRRSRTRS